MTKTTVIIGASIAGFNTANTLIKNNYDGKIIMIDKKTVAPYNPYPLSKDWMRDESDEPPYLQESSFYEQLDLRLGINVESFDPNSKTIRLDTKEELEYDTLVIAIGSRLRTLWAPHEDAEGIFYLRTYADALDIKTYAKDIEDVVIVGGGFLSLELAASMSLMGKNVTVLNRSEYPLGNVLGNDVSKYFMKMHLSNSVKIRTTEEVKDFEINKNNQVKAVNTNLDDCIKAQLVVIAVGVTPNLSLTHPDLELYNGAILVNEFNETSIEDVYAAGDIAAWKYLDDIIHIEHWENAFNQGVSTAKNILNKESNPFKTMPYFWTDQYDQTFEYLGHAQSWHKTVVRGSLSDRQFMVAYLDEDNVPLAILFANKMVKRKEVRLLLEKRVPLDESRFIDLDLDLSEI